ncbi:hypothetical protein CNMCM7691_006881 [Aspergillus felis]|uniref:Uncharacterized protein n=1 Tax=Aspergillus felis TaxID=1287682 RepID=A0A8H6QS64_9EURO|nr:hypothetical protein CNMCM7691_006881 [Aspergillus felis]
MRCSATLLGQQHLHQFICTAPVDREGHHTNYTHLLKIPILCYLSTQEIRERIGSRHPFRGAGSHNPPNPKLPTLLSPPHPVLDYSLSSMFLEQADFQAIQMKRDGTAFFSRTGIWFVIDQSALDTGRISVVDFKSNERVASRTQLRPWYLAELLVLYEDLGWPLRAIMMRTGFPRRTTSHMPLLDLLEETKKQPEFDWADWGSREL